MYKFSFFVASSVLGWLLFDVLGALLGLLSGGLIWLLARSVVWSTIDLLASWNSEEPSL